MKNIKLALIALAGITFIGCGGSSDSAKTTTDLTKDLVVYYQFENNTNDSSTNQYNADAYGVTTYVDGKIGKAISLDGVNDYVDTDGKMSANATDGDYLTYTAWINPTSCDTDSALPIIWDDDWQNGGDRGIGLTSINNECKFTLFREGDGFGNLYSHQNINLNEWQFVAFTLNGKNQKTLYINGKEDANSSIEYSFDHTGRSRIVIGSAHDGYWNHFKGAIDEVRVYKRALSKEEIQELYNEANK